MLFILISVVVVLLLVYDRLKFRHWAKRGVPCLTPVPFFGHYHPVTFGIVPPGMFYDYHVQKHKNSKYFGVYEYHRPTLVLNDLKLVEHVLVKDFSSFANHPRWVIDEHSYLNLMTLNLRGNLWRATRYRLTPSFTASKMQLALDRMLKHASPKFEEGEFEVQEKMNAIAADAIASYFGATIANKDAFARTMFEQTYTSPIRHVELQFLEHFPKLAALSGMSLFNEKINTVMKETSRQLLYGCGATSEFRTIIEGIKNDGVLKMKGKDFDINGNAEVEHVFEASEDLLIGQASQFLFAGLDATSNTMGFLAYELAANQDVQEKVRSEAKAALERHSNVWSYELLQELTYLQNCIHESMRMHSVKPFLFREATRDYTFPGTNLEIKKGEKLVIPAISFQMDPRFYPEPEKFKPERWSTEGKNKFTWLPFGEGPRQCLDDGFGPIYGSLVETNLKTSGSDYPDYQDDRSLYMYNSLPSPSSQCPSCFRDLNELDEFDMMGADVIYEDLMARTLMDRRKRRKKTSSTSSRGYPGPSVWEQNFGLNTLGHLRIDYSGNWNKLDSIIGHAC